MRVLSLMVGPIMTNCYILCDEAAKVCAVIDPGDEAGRIEEEIASSGCTPTMILLTHGHFDHCTGVAGLLEKWPELPVYIHEADVVDTVGDQLKFCRLGEKNQHRANVTAENGIFLSLCSFVVFLVIGLTCMKPYFYAQTSDPVIAQQGIRYLSVCCIFSLGIFTQTMGEKLLAATGRTNLSMISQLVGAVVNIILDPIFIFGYCGEALSGTTGAAVATVIGQFCGAGMTLYFNTRKNPDIQISFKGFRPSAKAIGRIYTVGLPSIAMQCVGSLMTFGMNLILMAFSATAVAVFGVYFKLQSFVFMPIFGLNNGMVPIISYNYGARRPDRVKKTIKLAVCYAEGIMLAGFCIFQFAPRQVLSIFAASDAMLAIGIPAMRIICLHFLLAGVSIVLSSVFQALGNGVFSLIVSVCRQLFVLLPAAWLLAQTGSVNNVWWAFLIAEVVSILMSLAFYARINKTTIAPLYH